MKAFTDQQYEAFTQDIFRFYKACQLNDDEAQDLIDSHKNFIKIHLAATPELIARKIYLEVNDNYIN